MCGIVGSLQWQTPDSEQLIQRMTSMLAHRGPDAEKVVSLGPMVLGHRRLSIIDVSPLSDQPMADNTGRYWIVYNGELYNFKVLKKELLQLGHFFITESDTEVILEAWKRYGIDCLQKFVGMFAFAIWDKEQENLFLARDRMGEKPLYYSSLTTSAVISGSAPDHNIVFASEMKALCLHPNISNRINPNALSEFLSLNYILTDSCILQGVEKLPPAHYLLLKRGRPPEIRNYWNLSEHYRNKDQNNSKVYIKKAKEEAAEKLRSMIQSSVQDQMVSDVPLGAFLSGGIDSSTIVAAMSQADRNAAINTFSIGFHEDSYSELAESKMVAEYLKVDHHTQCIEAERVKQLPAIVQTSDEPFADSSLIPTYFLSEFSSQKVKVCLSGDGGDELFAGYETYTADKLYQYMQSIPKELRRFMGTMVEKYWPVSHNKVSLDYKLKQFLKGSLFDFHRAHYFWRVIFSDQEKQNILKEEVRNTVMQHDPFLNFAKHFQAVSDCHPLDQALYVDIKTWMVDDILVKVDRFSMAHSLEVRAPFLNHHLVEFAASLPVDWKMKMFQKKHILKLSQQNNLPSSILHRPKKGFSAPISPWFSGKLQNMAREATLDNPFLWSWLERSAIETLWKEQRSGVKDQGLKLFGLMCLGLWLENSHHIFLNREQPLKQSIHQPSEQPKLETLERGTI